MSMTINELLKVHEKTCQEARDIIVKKNNDYTCKSKDIFANFRTTSIFNIPDGIGLLIRVVDKLKRIETFIRKDKLEVNDDTIDDAFKDVINYMILLQGMLKQKAYTKLGIKNKSKIIGEFTDHPYDEKFD